jgi:hypothetical protein
MDRTYKYQYISQELLLGLVLLLLAAVTAFGQNETQAVDRSALAGVKLPQGAQLVNEASVPTEIKQALAKIVEEGGGKIRQGESEVLIWTGSDLRSKGANSIVSSLAGSLKSGGWEYEVSGTETGVSIFSVLRSEPERRGLLGLFTISGSYGSDGAGSLSTAVSFTGVPAGGLATNLVATDGGAITLNASSPTLLTGTDTQGHTVFTIEIINVGGSLQLQTTLYEALDNGNDSLYDEAVQLLLDPGNTLSLHVQVTRVDGDGDQIVASDTIVLANNTTSAFSFDDDGPSQSVTATAGGTAAVTVSLDETTGATDH